MKPPNQTGVAISTMRISPGIVSSGLGSMAARLLLSIDALARRSGSDEALDTRTMSSMGRMPAIGSFENGNAIATAPSSFPPM